MPINDFSEYPMSWRPQRSAFPEGPYYLALAALLERDIASGLLPPGTRLPPQRELADYLDLNFTTVTRAYDLCREKRLVYGVVGRGTFVASLPGRAEGEGVGLLDFGVVQGFPGIGAKSVVAAAQAVLSRESAERLFTYNAREGHARAREAGRLWLARTGVSVPAARVVVFPGVQSALSTALLSLFRVGETLAVDEFTYGNLISLARLARVRLVAVSGDDEGMLPSALDAVARRHQVKGVFVMPRCANPTTSTMSVARRIELAQVARARNLLVLEDDAALTPDPDAALQAHVPERTVYLAGSSRLVAPGLRATFVAVPESLSSALLAGLYHTAIKASALDAEILGELVLSGAANRVLNLKLRAAQRANRVFNRVFGTTASETPPLFRRLPFPDTAGHGPEIERTLRARGVVALHSDRFRVGRTTSSFLRLSISNFPGEKGLGAALHVLKAIVGDCGPRKA